MMRSLSAVFLVALLVAFPAHAKRRHRRSPASVSADSPDAALGRILSYEDRRIAPADLLVRYLSYPNQTVRKAAVIALGRIGDTSGLDEMAAILTKKDLEMRRACAFALSLMPDETSGKILSQNIPMHKDAETRSILYENFGRRGGESAARLLLETLQVETNALLFPSLYEGIGLAWSNGGDSSHATAEGLKLLVKGSTGQRTDAITASFAVSRYKGKTELLPVTDMVLSSATAPQEFSRSHLTRALGRVQGPFALAGLLRSLRSLSVAVRIEAVRGLSQQNPTPDVIAGFGTALQDPQTPVVIEALQVIPRIRNVATPLLPAVLSLWRTSKSNWVKGAALRALSALDPAVGRVEVNRIISTPGSPHLTDALLALGFLPDSSDLLQLAQYLQNPDLKLAAFAAEALSQVDPKRIGSEIRGLLRTAVERKDARLSTILAQMAAQNQWKDFVAPLITLCPLLTDADHLEARIAVLSAFGYLSDTAAIPVLQSAMTSKQRPVVEAATRSLFALSGQDLRDKIPLNTLVDAVPPTLADVRSALMHRVVVKTTRGEIHLKLFREAPLTAFHFVNLVKKGFYSGLTFHRVVPNFVAQGGDPRGDGFGGPGYLIRDEFSEVKHERGTVGIATAGKDTGGSQFFINLAPNLHLNGRYTVFAEVTEGMAVADKLEVGDQIISAELKY